jgi:hypothetical protein
MRQVHWANQKQASAHDNAAGALVEEANQKQAALYDEKLEDRPTIPLQEEQPPRGVMNFHNPLPMSRQCHC